MPIIIWDCQDAEGFGKIVGAREREIYLNGVTHAKSKVILDVDLAEVVWEKLCEDLRDIVLGGIELHIDSLRELTPDVGTANVSIITS
jgi:hypothetical protein